MMLRGFSSFLVGFHSTAAQRDFVFFRFIYENLATRVCREDVFVLPQRLHYRSHHKSVNLCHSAVTVCSINLNLLQGGKGKRI